MNGSSWPATGLLLFAAATIAAAPNKKAAKAPSPDAARVAILLYDDKTGTKNFEYMPGSLKEAITNSMHEKFEFHEIDTSKVDPIVERVKAKSKGSMGAKEAADICRQADIDILIYGNFTFNEDANQIVINTNISLGSTDKFRSLPSVENRVDSTIFRAADKVATDIVAEITKVALEQQQAKGKALEADKNKKTQLEKTEKNKTWADLNWTITPSLGMHFPFIDRTNAVVKEKPVASLLAMYRLKNRLHVGAYTSFFSNFRSYQKIGPYNVEIHYMGSTLNLGYYFDLSARWRLTTLAGVGYYFGTYSVSVNCPPGGQCIAPNVVPEKRIQNPFFMARTGVQYLILSFLAIGLEVDYHMLYDRKLLQAAGGVLSIVFTF